MPKDVTQERRRGLDGPKALIQTISRLLLIILSLKTRPQPSSFYPSSPQPSPPRQIPYFYFFSLLFTPYLYYLYLYPYFLSRYRLIIY